MMKRKMPEYKLKTPKAIEKAVAGTYQKIEGAVVGAYRKIEDRFVSAFLEEADASKSERDLLQKPKP